MTRIRFDGRDLRIPSQPRAGLPCVTCGHPTPERGGRPCARPCPVPADPAPVPRRRATVLHSAPAATGAPCEFVARGGHPRPRRRRGAGDEPRLPWHRARTRRRLAARPPRRRAALPLHRRPPRPRRPRGVRRRCARRRGRHRPAPRQGPRRPARGARRAGRARGAGASLRPARRAARRQRPRRRRARLGRGRAAPRPGRPAGRLGAQGRRRRGGRRALGAQRRRDRGGRGRAGGRLLLRGPLLADAHQAGPAGTGAGPGPHGGAARAGRPWFAIGGIDGGRLDEVLAAGAERVVVVRAITEADDPRAAAAALAARLRRSARGDHQA